MHGGPGPEEPSRGQNHNDIVIAAPSSKRRRKEKEKSSEQQYHSPQQISKNLNLPKDQTKEEDITHQLRQSNRVPRVLAKYLESIKAELQDSDSKYIYHVSLQRPSNM